MKKYGAALFIVFLVVMTSAGSSPLSYEETEKVSLGVIASDPDDDEIKIYYGEPLNEEGEWQTTYGDAGVYTLDITVSDGLLSETEEIVLLITKKEEVPEIIESTPSGEELEINEGKELHFTIVATDLNKDQLEYVWMFDRKEVGNENEYVFSPNYGQEGTYEISVQVSDGISTTKRSWIVIVNDVDLKAILLDKIEGGIFKEGEVVRLSFPDFRYYGLQFDISKPLGNKNYWKTDYNSAGIYNIPIRVWGEGYEQVKEIEITVENFDRPPKFEKVDGKFLYEGDFLNITLEASDPDGDKINFSVNNLPEGAKFTDNTLTWAPSVDLVLNTGVVTSFFRKFNVLSRVFEVEFVATSKERSTTMVVPITVLNQNRGPVLEKIEDVEIDEGDTLWIDVSGYDPDNDKLIFTFSEWIGNGEVVGYDETGIHYVKVKVSDGFEEDSQYVKVVVNDINRAPSIETPNDVVIVENKSVQIQFSAFDPDGDLVTFFLLDAPEDAVIEENVFSWTPGFEVTSKDFISKFTIKVLASDGSLGKETEFSISVLNKNRAPEIIDVPLEVSVKKDVPLTLVVDAYDPDGDNLTITWKFGREEYEGNMHKRTFTSTGTKKGMVSISDGEIILEREFVITVN